MRWGGRESKAHAGHVEAGGPEGAGHDTSSHRQPVRPAVPLPPGVRLNGAQVLKQLGDGQHRRIPSLGKGFAQEDGQLPRLGDVGRERKGINVGRLCGWVGAVPELHGCGRDDCHGVVLAEVEPLSVDPVVAEPLVAGKFKISPATDLPHDVQAHWRSRRRAATFDAVPIFTGRASTAPTRYTHAPVPASMPPPPTVRP